MRNRKGFTLLELMVITVIVGILATIALGAFTSVRERGMTAAARTEIRNAINAAEIYYTVNGVYPASMADLVNAGIYSQSSSVDYCVFQLQAGPPPDLLLEVAHRGSNVHLSARYPSAGVNIQETTAAADCS